MDGVFLAWNRGVAGDSCDTISLAVSIDALELDRKQTILKVSVAAAKEDGFSVKASSRRVRLPGSSNLGCDRASSFVANVASP